MKESTSGWINGFLGVIIFAGSLPATRIAVAEFNPIFLTSARAVIATLLGIILILSFKQPYPKREDAASLIIIALGVVIGFPLLTAFALQYVTSAHSIVFVGLLPLCTAVFASTRGAERPKPLFWLFSILGAASVVGYALTSYEYFSLKGDLLMLAAIIVCGLAYSEGGRLSRKIGGWQVICWSLILSLPVMLPMALITLPESFEHVTTRAVISLGYVSLCSMLLGFVFWYRGLAQGGVAAVGQIQLLQPFIGLGLAALLLNETINWSMLIVTLIAAICVAAAKQYAN